MRDRSSTASETSKASSYLAGSWQPPCSTSPSLYVDVADSGTKTTTILPYLLLFVALLIALGFEFVNGFHDTANAVATVIYTHSMPAPVAVVWSGFFNFLGVVLSSGAVAFGILSLLPVCDEMIPSY